MGKLGLKFQVTPSSLRPVGYPTTQLPTTKREHSNTVQTTRCQTRLIKENV